MRGARRVGEDPLPWMEAAGSFFWCRLVGLLCARRIFFLTRHVQQWQVIDLYGQLPLLKNLGTGTCLDADGTNKGNGAPIFQWACNTSDSRQQWWFYGSGQLNTNGNADAGVHSQGNGTCLDADGTSRGNGAPIFQWACNQNDTYQQWN